MITLFDNFKKIYEENNLRTMSLIIPEKKNWIKNGENYAISYMGRNYGIPENKIEELEGKIGKEIKFKFNPNENIIILDNIN